VVVLVPAMFGAANDFRLMARDLVARVPGVQVWAVDRREEGTVVESARRVGAESRIPYAAYETDDGMNHLDPLFAATEHNTATRTLAEFLGKVGAGAR
jgi:acyl dehydratase